MSQIPAMALNPFIDAEHKLRNGWWIAIFFLVLAALLFPLLMLARNNNTDLPLVQQAGVVILASLICQWFRKKPLSELLGKLDRKWPMEWAIGCTAGGLLMLLPATALWALGYADWRMQAADFTLLLPVIITFVGVALAEEFVFRGFMFQRLMDGIGLWPAQLLMAAYFVLTHSATLETAGQQKYLACVNIFLASIMFGLAFIRTKSLALPIGLHFAANTMQGAILGFGVSGNEQASLLHPILSGPDWFTGGAFGLEASVPGLIFVIFAVIVLIRWRRPELLIKQNIAKY